MIRLIILLILAVVPALFSLSLSVNENGFVNLGSLAPGQSEFDGGFNYANNTIVSLNVAPASLFTLEIEMDGFHGPAPMSPDVLSWHLCYAHAGISSGPWVHELTSAYKRKAFSFGKDVVYSYSPISLETGSYQFNFLWHIVVPTTQPSGTYFTNVFFTLTQ